MILLFPRNRCISYFFVIGIFELFLVLIRNVDCLVLGRIGGGSLLSANDLLTALYGPRLGAGCLPP